MSKNNILICFCKHPVAGLVKSRLAKNIGEAAAADVYLTLLEHTLLNAQQTNLKVLLYCHPDIHHPTLQSYVDKFNVTLLKQIDGDLGAKMHHAMQQHIEKDANVVLIGTDCLELDANYILQAFHCLNTDSDIVLAPTEDGGYSLIGANKIDQAVFQDISWSTDSVLDKTTFNINKLGWKYTLLDETRDLDNADDLNYFSQHEKYKHLFIQQDN